MVEVTLENVTMVYSKEVRALDDINWTVPDKTINGLLGPSGCGKTTLMNIIAGLLKPTKGKVLFDGKDVTDLTPQERNVCMIFQKPVVYPYMTVYENISFPLKNMKTPMNVIKERVYRILEFLHLDDQAGVKAGKLSLGDQQKVSLGRVLVRENPCAILLDEPLTNIEPERRPELRILLKEAIKEFTTTMIFVTHDQSEALTVADKIAVMKNGRILQFSTKEELFEHPKHTFIGFFIGSPGMNFINCSIHGDLLDFQEFTTPIPNRAKALKLEGDGFQIGIRPEYVQVNKKERKDWIKFNVKAVRFAGNILIATINKGEIEIRCSLPIGFNIKEEDKVWVSFPEDKIRIYNNKGELLI